MNKHVLPGMSPIYENMARSVVQAHKKINGQNTAPTGTISFHRSNGSKDIYGSLNKDGYSVAKNVGDTVAPGRPLGISAKSVGGILYVSWDGELEGGLPSDFYCVRAYLKVENKIHVIGELTSKGNLSYKSLGEGVQGTVYATAEDETCNEDGTPNHNVSEKSDEINVVGSQIPIQGVDVEYALGNSQTTPPESGWSTTAPEWQEGMYMWQRTVTYTSDGSSYSDPTCIQGAAGRNGVDGKDGTDGTSGRGIASTEVKYQSSQSSTTVPTGEWLTAIPSVQEGWYLWTRTQFTYTDSTVSYGYSVSRQGADGAAGSDGKDGTDGRDGANGVGVSGSEVRYQASNSGTTAPTGSWLTSPPSLDAGQYLWTRTTITYTDGKSTVSYSISMKGETGPQGLQGKPGADGQPRYTWLKYADTPTSGMSDLPDGKDYIGLAYNKTTPSESSNYSDYTWSKIVGEQGPQGVQGERGVPGPAGEDGSTLYTWIKYADNASGGGMSDNPSGKKYIGLAYNKTVPIESSVASDYTWSLIQGADGKDGTDGRDGANGVGVSGSEVRYQASNSGTTAPTGSWLTSPPSLDAGQYLWTRTTITYTDGKSTVSYSISMKGETGPQGLQGKPGADGQPRYTWLKYADTPTSGMSDLPDGKDYIGLAYNKTTPSESSNYSDYTWSKIVGEQGPQGVQGERGVPGPAGEDGSTLYTWIKYADNASGGGMSDNPSGKKYIGLAYNKTVPIESSVASDYTWSLIQGADGKDGADGDPGIGIKAVVEQYYLSTSSTAQSGGSWSTNQPEWSKGKYLWTRSQVTWTDNEITTTTPVLAKAINKANENANEAINKAKKINYYFWTDSSGAHVTTKPNDATTGPNILIDGNGFHIRQGNVETAFFKSDEIGLGSNSQTSVIRMCGGLGEIGTVSSSGSSVLALFGELVGLRGSNGSVVGNNLANLTLTDDDAVLTANGSIIFNSKTVHVGTDSLDSRVYLHNARGWIEPIGSSVDDASSGISIHGKKSIGLVVSAGTSSANDFGIYLQNSGGKYEDSIISLNAYRYLFGSNGDLVKSKDVYRAMHFEDWKTLYENSTYGKIKYGVFAGIVFLYGRVSGVNKSWGLDFPIKYCPEIGRYFPATLSVTGGTPPNNTASIWLAEYRKNGSSKGNLYIYTNGSSSANEFVNFTVSYPYCGI